jgi:flagellar biosynthesis/type III secretory pathway protein FliH
MTILKSGLLERPAELPAFRFESPQPVPTVAELELRTQLERNERLSEELARLRETLQVDARNGEKAYQRGVSDGREAAAREAAAIDGERLTLIRKTAAEAVAELRQALGRLESLAPAVALAALDRLFADPGARSGFVLQQVRMQIQALAGRAVLAVEVAQRDVETEDAAAQLKALVEGVGAELRVLDTLPPGTCRLRTQLGGVDIGFDQQWGALRRLLEELAEPRP